MKILVTLPLDERQKNRLEMNFKHQEFVYCLAEDVTKEVIRDAEVILGHLDPAFLQYAEELKWLQLNNAGTEGFCDGALPKGVMLTNATGAYGLAISEHMIGVLFELQKKLNLYEKNQREHLWKKEGHVQVIEGSRVLVIGLGLLIRYLTKNESLAYGFYFLAVAGLLAVYLTTPEKFEGLLPALMKELSLFERFSVFVNGVFDMTGIVFYVTFAAFFLFLSVQSLEKRRYN